MNKLYPHFRAFMLIFLLGIAQLAQAQFDFSATYGYSHPRGLMQQYINSSHGLFLEGLYRLPNTRLSVGLQVALSVYGMQERQDTYMFNSGAEQEVDVNISNNFALTGAVLRYALSANTGFIPYVTSKIGLSTFWTDLTIEERNNGGGHGSCPEPIESDVLLSDVALQYSFGAGMQIDMSKFINSLRKEFVYLDLQASYLRGGNIRYMSVGAPSQNTVTRTRAVTSDPVTLPFVSEMEPDIIHDYHVGTSYRSDLDMINFQFGVLFRW